MPKEIAAKQKKKEEKNNYFVKEMSHVKKESTVTHGNIDDIFQEQELEGKKLR